MVRPLSRARPRSRTWWALEPVKWCRAVANCASGTTRRSAWRPLCSRTERLVLGEALEDLLLHLLAEPLQLAHAVGAAGVGDFLQRLGAQLLEQDRGALGAQPRHMHQLERRAGQLSPQLLEVLEAAGGDE